MSQTSAYWLLKWDNTQFLKNAECIALCSKCVPGNKIKNDTAINIFIAVHSYECIQSCVILNFIAGCTFTNNSTSSLLTLQRRSAGYFI